MPPNPRVKKAFRAMKNIGISEEKVKPVLKSLLKLYDKNWELIEEENYRALADAIFEKEDAEAVEHKKPENNEPLVQREEVLEEEAVHEEPERPLKRLRLRYLEGQASPSTINSGAETSLKRPRREEEGELPGRHYQNQSQGEANPSSNRNNLRLNETQTSPIVSRGKSFVAAKSSHASKLKEPKTEPGGELSPKQKMSGSLALIKPKDEPYTDDMPQFEVPIAVIHPEPSNKGDTSSGNASRRRSETSEPLAVELRGGRDAGEEITALSNGVTTSRELVEVQDRCHADVDIASSPSGEVFMTPEGKGWGLRTLEDLPRGAFVCEYVGEVLTNAELFGRVSRSPNGEEHSYPVLLDANWGSEGVLKDEEALCLDATFYGNVARFINHRCFDSNLVEIPIEIETPDHHYYHLAFFTTRKIKAMEELTWDYGIDFDDLEHPVKAFSCHCSSKFCRNMKRPSRSRSRR